jgi:hypothetical protein
MAEMQLRSLGHSAELLAVGAFNQRLNALHSNSHALFESIREAMSRQTSTKAPVIDNARLHELHRTFDALCDSLNMLEIPPMLLHGDMNTGNVLYDDSHCQFIDWCETYVGHPFVTLQHLLLLDQPEDAWLKSKWDAELLPSSHERSLGSGCLRPGYCLDAFHGRRLLPVWKRRLVWFAILPAAAATSKDPDPGKVHGPCRIRVEVRSRARGSNGFQTLIEVDDDVAHSKKLDVATLFRLPHSIP